MAAHTMPDVVYLSGRQVAAVREGRWHVLPITDELRMSAAGRNIIARAAWRRVGGSDDDFPGLWVQEAR